jgi:hypothetical protein
MGKRADNWMLYFCIDPGSCNPEQLEPDVGVISYHLAFDERLTLGFNPRLAEVLGMSANRSTR